MPIRVAAIAVVLTLASWEARADFWGDVDIQVIAGARLFSDQNKLGRSDPDDTSVSNSVVGGARFGYRVYSWLAVETEAPLYLTSTRVDDTTVLAFDPRVHAVFDVLPDARVQPFGVIGGGGPMSFSFDTDVLGHGIMWEGYFGGGVRFVRDKGWSVRLDARWSIVPAAGDSAVTSEFEFLATLYRPFGPEGRREHLERIGRIEAADADGDGIPDDEDECPDRPEDKDKYKDKDGCPDIDNDLDGVIDDADKCPLERETYNGFQDLDGCLDFIPDEVREWEGTSSEVAFVGSGTRLSKKSTKTLRKVAEDMLKHRSIKIDIVAGTLERAVKVRDYLLDKGVKAPRLRASGRDDGEEGVELNLRVPKGYE